MDGIHDLGGKHGHGAVETDAAPTNFVQRWQGRVFGLNNRMFRLGITHNTDYFRHAIERMTPAAYLTHGYYGRWLAAIETILVEQGILRSADIEKRLGPEVGPSAARPDPDPTRFAYTLRAYTARRQIQREQRFVEGDQVLTATHTKPGHTRLPAYVRGRVGRVVAVHGAWVYPDDNAHARGDEGQHLYTVEFSAAELWGADTRGGDSVCVDLFEPYLQAAQRAADDVD
ncbi:MAG: nitrile hydratase subunit beta [Pseudomonadota bacterium]